MSDIKDFPAFPRKWDKDGHNGMTLRDYFAAHALSGLYTPTIDDGTPLEWKHEALAQAAYMAADAMMIARKS
jgi:hypothetical protein